MSDANRTLVVSPEGAILPEELNEHGLTYKGRRLAVVALLDDDNVFTNVNTFPGIRFGVRIVSSDYTLTALDFLVLVNASAGPVTISLPAALATGQVFRVKKYDESDNPVTVDAQIGDLIDDDPSVVLSEQFGDLTVFDGDTGFWDKLSSGGGVVTDVARLSQENTFQQVNNFTGVRLATKTVTADYQLTSNDFEVLVNAASGPATVTLPASSGGGQLFRVKKIDTSDNIVTIQAAGSDVIDGSISVNLADQYADCQVFDADSGYWDNTGFSNALIIPSDPPTRPNTLNQVIALLTSYGLCQ